MNGEEEFERGKEFYDQKEYLKAIECYNKALKDTNYDTPGKARNSMGIAYGNLGKHEKAIECYKKALGDKNYDTPGKAQNNMGIAYGNLGKHEKAIECYKKALGDKNYDTPGKAQNNMGIAYGNLGKHEKAIECYKKALGDKNYDTPGKAQNNMGIAYGNLGKHEKAIECYKKALEDENFDTPGKAQNNMGIAYGNLGKHEKAIECYKKALEDENFDTPSIAWSNMGTVYYDLKKYDKAIECYKKAIRCDPKYADAYNNLGEALYKIEEDSEIVEKKFRKAIQIKSTLSESHYYLGHILADEKYYKDAKKEYEIALKSEPENANYLNSLGYVLAKLGRYDKAKKNFKKAVSSDPTHVKAHRNIRLLNKTSEMKYKAPALLKYGLMAVIISVIISSHYLLHGDKLSDSKFTALIIVLVGLLTAIVLLPESKYFKVGPSGIEFSRDTEGKPMKPELAESHELER